MKTNTDYLNKAELAVRLGLPSKGGVEEMMRRRKIPYITLGHRTVRFYWPAVEKALVKFEIKVAGRE